MQVVPRSSARSGDLIEVSGHAVGAVPRVGEIVETARDEDGAVVRYRVRWEDGHEAVLFPGDDVVVRRAS